MGMTLTCLKRRFALYYLALSDSVLDLAEFY